MLESTLEELEKEYWGEPEFNSHLVTECYRLRKVPFKHFTNENLRIMLGQKFSVKYLLPLAIEALEKDPLAEGDFYPGYLLQSVLSLPEEEWKNSKDYLERTKNIIKSMNTVPKELNDALQHFNKINA